MLRLFILLGHDQTAGQVCDPDRTIGCIHRLPTRTACTVDINPQILVLDLNVDVFGFRQHGNRRGGRMNTAARLGLGHTLHTMDTGLELELGKHTLAR